MTHKIVLALCLALIAGTNFSQVLAQAMQGSGAQHLVINADQGNVTISRHIYGHFAEHLGRGIYDGLWTKAGTGSWHYNDQVIEALKKIKVPNLRWPGGCFADYYHWQDGIGPREERPMMVNTMWGGVTEDNSFGIHEYMDLVQRLGTEPFIVGNVGSGTPREMSEWWEYINYPGKSPMADLRRANGREEPWNVRMWGVGNESWGCGGNMTAEYYANEYKRYATFLRSYGDVQPFRIATGPNVDMYDWTEIMMQNAGDMIDALDLHSYSYTGGSWGNWGKATDFTESQWYELLQKAIWIQELIEKHSTIMDRYDPEKRVALLVGEWGSWHQVEQGTNPGFLYQQNALRDALVASVSLDIFNNHADRVRMANIAQTVNVLQAMILTDGEEIVLTPTYHVFDFYSVHHDATLLPITLDAGEIKFENWTVPAISASASMDKAGKMHITMTNLDARNSRTIATEIRGKNVSKVSGRILTAKEMNAFNWVDHPDSVKPVSFDGASLSDNQLTVKIPSKSIVVLELE